MRKVGGVQYFTNKQIIPNKTIGGGKTAQHYSTVKIPRTKPRDTRTQYGVKDRGKVREEDQMN